MDAKKNSILLLGVVYEKDLCSNKNKIGAVKLYDRKRKQCEFISTERLIKWIESGMNIIGVKLEKTKANNTVAVFEKGVLDYRKLSELDGSGKIINKKKDVILGRKEGKYLVIDAELNERLLTKEEIYEEKPYGFYGNVILNICRINLEEE